MRFFDGLRDRVDGGRSADGREPTGRGTDERGVDSRGSSERCCRCLVEFDDGSGPGPGSGFGLGSESAGGPMSDSAVLRVDASECFGGDLAAESACRATVIDALADRDADLVRVRNGGLDRFYEGDAAALLLAAGRFADAVEGYEPDIARRARSAPVTVAREAVGRAGPVARLAAETGFTAWADGSGDAGTPPRSLRASVAPAGALGRTQPARPSDAVFRGTTDLDTGGSATVYDRPDVLPHYHLMSTTRAFSTDALDVLATAADALATGEVSHGPRSHRRAVRHAATDRGSGSADAGDTPDPFPIEALTEALRRHTRGLGVLDELFADERVTDAFMSAPAANAAIRAVVDGEAMTTNVRLSAADIDALASRVRAASGRAFSRASPTAYAALGDIRVAAVTDPASDGRGFALRRRDDDPWTLPRLVSVGSLSPWAAGLLSVTVERGAAILVAGPRGAGKTSLLGALCLEVPVDTRTILIEDTPELPVAAIRDAGRDVQPLSAGTDGDDALAPTDAVRTALRLGEGALVVGEVRGPEARALYEAMRVGAAADAVLGTIHGTGGRAVRERVVSDLGVPASSFATTDLVVTLGPDRTLASVEEVQGPVPGDLTTLAERDGRGGVGDGDDGTGDRGGDDEGFHPAATPTGTIDRGESGVIADLAGPGEAYADVRDAVRRRARTIRTLADAGRTDTGGIDAADVR